MGLITVAFYIFANLKDTTIFLYYLIWGGLSGFDNALKTSAKVMILDIFLLIVLIIWGSIVLG